MVQGVHPGRVPGYHGRTAGAAQSLHRGGTHRRGGEPGTEYEAGLGDALRPGASQVRRDPRGARYLAGQVIHVVREGDQVHALAGCGSGLPRRSKRSAMKAFLDSVAGYLLETQGKGLSEACMVFPNRRSGLFFNRYLSARTPQTMWAPRVI